MHRWILSLETTNWTTTMMLSRCAVYTGIVLLYWKVVGLMIQPRNRVVCRLASEMIKGWEVSECNRDGCVADGHNYSRTLYTRISHAISMPEWIRALYRDEKAGIRKGQTPRKLMQTEWRRKKSRARAPVRKRTVTLRPRATLNRRSFISVNCSNS